MRAVRDVLAAAPVRGCKPEAAHRQDPSRQLHAGELEVQPRRQGCHRADAAEGPRASTERERDPIETAVQGQGQAVARRGRTRG